MKARKFFAFILAFVLVCTAVLPMTAFAAGIEISKDCPYIHVIGFMSEPLYKNPGTEKQEQIWPPKSEDIVAAVKKTLPTLAIASATKEWDMLCDVLIPEVKKLFEPACLDKNGNAVENTGIDYSYPTEQFIRSGEQTSFRYDWRLSPLEIADQLNDYIEYVCRITGKNKVCLEAHSCGGIITMSYINKYGLDRIKGVVLDSTAIFGETYTGELLTGQIAFNKDSLTSFLKYVMDGEEYENLVNSVLTLFSKAGVLDYVMQYLNELLDGIRERAIPEVVMPLFCRWLTVWAMCPDEYLSDAYNYVFGEACDSDPTEYAALIAKIKAYDMTVKANKVSLLKETEKNCRLGVFSSYGFSAVPATPSWDSTGDGVIDAKYTSFGATVAPFGKVFSDEYIASKDGTYISPDRMVDASTCLFPEKTWFIKGLKHSVNHDSLDELAQAILYSDKEVTVDTFEEYPRFLAFDNKSESVTKNESTDKENIFTKWFKAFSEFVNLLKSLFQKIFK